MPTVIIVQGFRFFFYSNENDEPMHIHIEKGSGEGKVWLEPEIVVEYMFGFTVREQRQILGIIEKNTITLKEKWNDYFSQ